MKFKYKRVILIVSVTTMCFGMAALSTQGSQGKKGTNEQNQNINQEEENIYIDAKNGALTKKKSEETKKLSDYLKEESVTAYLSTQSLEKNKIPEINSLVAEYLNARLSGDEKRLKRCVEDISALDMADIKRRTERIESYEVIDCYTIPGPEEGAYVVYVYTETKFTGIETLVTGLDCLYLRKNDEGKLRICKGDIPDDIYNKIIAYGEQEEVVTLSQMVNDKLKKEAETDSNLADYLAELNAVDIIDGEEETDKTSDSKKEDKNQEKEDTENSKDEE